MGGVTSYGGVELQGGVVTRGVATIDVVTRRVVTGGVVTRGVVIARWGYIKGPTYKSQGHMIPRSQYYKVKSQGCKLQGHIIMRLQVTRSQSDQQTAKKSVAKCSHIH